MRICLAATLLCVATTSLSAAPKPEDTWPGFRGHEMSGVAPGATIPERWSTTDHVKWAVPVAGHGWSSPIVWGDTVFITSAISSRPFKKPAPGVDGKQVIGGMQGEGGPEEKIGKRAQARDNELEAETDEN